MNNQRPLNSRSCCNENIFDIEAHETREWLKTNTTDKNTFITRLKSDFKYLRGYHGTKIYNFDDFDRGLFPADEQIIKSRAKKIFRSDSKEINEVIDDVIEAYNIFALGELHYHIHKISFKKSYQYLFFGSEDLIRIADKIKQKVRFSGRKILINSGKSAIIYLNIPTSKLSRQELDELYDFFDSFTPVGIDEVYKLDSHHSFIHQTVINNIEKIEFVKRPINKGNMPEH